MGDSLIVSTVSGNKYVKLIRDGSEIDMLKAVTKQSTMSLMLHVGSNDLQSQPLLTQQILNQF